MRLSCAALTDRGRVRPNNEDSMYADLEHGLFAVADGMGGHAAGEVASALAVEVVGREYAAFADGRAKPAASPDPVREVLTRAFAAAHEAILARGRTAHGTRGMGTTLTALVLRDGRARIGHIGDSRAYLLRDGRLMQLTRDHSYVQELVRRGVLPADGAAAHPLRNVITRSLGSPESAEMDFAEDEARPGDVFLLCSDGLSGPVDDEEIRKIALARLPDLNELARALVAEANRRGGPDNTTVLVVRVEG